MQAHTVIEHASMEYVKCELRSLNSSSGKSGKPGSTNEALVAGASLEEAPRLLPTATVASTQYAIRSTYRQRGSIAANWAMQAQP